MIFIYRKRFLNAYSHFTPAISRCRTSLYVRKRFFSVYSTFRDADDIHLCILKEFMLNFYFTLSNQIGRKNKDVKLNFDANFLLSIENTRLKHCCDLPTYHRQLFHIFFYNFPSRMSNFTLFSLFLKIRQFDKKDNHNPTFLEKYK